MPKVTRRGFLGILGASGVAAALPWKKSKPKPVDVSEYITDYDINLEHSADGEHWLDDLREEGVKVEGYWDPSPEFEHGQVCNITIDGITFDAREININMPAPDIIETTEWSGNRTYIQGLKDPPEIDCRILDKREKIYKFNSIIQKQEPVDFKISLSDMSYEGKAYLTNTLVSCMFDDTCDARITLKATGEMRRCQA
jgi:hypothetical protein